MATTANVDLITSAEEYLAAYREYEAATQMNVPTPEGVGTFGGVWDCNENRLLRALVLAIHRTSGVCSGAAVKVVRGEAICVADGDYGPHVSGPGPVADVYRMPNGLMRGVSGRYLTATESAIITRALRGRSVTARTVTDEEWDRCHAYAYTAGRLTQRWIDSQAPDQIAAVLTKSYMIGWPACTDQQKIDAYRRVRDIYRTLTAAYRDAELEIDIVGDGHD